MKDIIAFIQQHLPSIWVLLFFILLIHFFLKKMK